MGVGAKAAQKVNSRADGILTLKVLGPFAAHVGDAAILAGARKNQALLASPHFTYQLHRRRFGRDAELLRKQVAQPVVLLERGVATALPVIGADQAPMHMLLERILREEALSGRDGLLGFSRRVQSIDEAHAIGRHLSALAALVKNELRKEPFTGPASVFRAKRADRLKLLYWEGTGPVMAYKRLEEHSFRNEQGRLMCAEAAE